ncbi:MAG: nucleoside hydrolase [Parachlamydia sp.]|nr:nucleoside hydrolase [Parachlamydia sp.]
MLTLTTNLAAAHAQTAAAEAALSTAFAPAPATVHSPVQNSVQKIANEMERRNSLGYGLGRMLGKALGTVTDEPELQRPIKRAKVVPRQQPVQNETVPFMDVYKKLFPQDTLRVLYAELDPGVDDGAALLQLLAATKNSTGTQAKKVEIVGLIPSCGNAVLSQTEQNTMQFLELTGDTQIKVAAGAVAPLADQNNQTAINIDDKGINATRFYGGDGEEDVGGWPKVKMKLQTKPGYIFGADAISAASPEAPLTLVSTSALTELSQILTELVSRDAKNGLPPGSFAKNINVISIMGGCMNPQVTGCNAPFNVPDSQKTSEANFYFDPLAAQTVFSICQQHRIPILLAPLDLTQQPGLLWTKSQVATLNQTGNPVATQWAKVTNVVPYLDAPCFPNGTYPMHDLQATANLLYPELYTVTPMSVSIGNIGQVIVNQNATDAEKNVYVLSMPQENQAKFYGTLLPAFNNFRSTKRKRSIGKIAGIAAAAVGGVAVTVAGGVALHKRVRRSKRLSETSPLIQA